MSNSQIDRALAKQLVKVADNYERMVKAEAEVKRLIAYVPKLEEELVQVKKMRDLSVEDTFKVQNQLAATELCLEKMRENVKAIKNTAYVWMPIHSNSNELLQMCIDSKDSAFTRLVTILATADKALQLQPSLSALNEERAKVLEKFAGQMDCDPSLYYLADCKNLALRMASNLRRMK
jgi:hypothetical protein